MNDDLRYPETATLEAVTTTEPACMLDSRGNPVKVGADVLFRGRGTWLRGTVRAVTKREYSRKRGGPVVRWEANVDDGDAGNPNLRSNRFSCAAWVTSSQIVVRAP